MHEIDNAEFSVGREIRVRTLRKLIIGNILNFVKNIK